MKVTYYDCGLHKEAPEIDMFLEICQELGLDYQVYGIEACSEYIPQIQEKYAQDPNIEILHRAVSGTNEMLRLYKTTAFDGEGNSIFDTKNNVNPNWYEDVQGLVMSTFIERTAEGDLIVLKFNIEGAEYYMMNDLLISEVYKKIDIFCGSTPDIHKVREIEVYQPDYEQRLIDAGIVVSLFHNHPNPGKVQEMKTRMKRELNVLIDTSSRRKE